MSELTYLTKEGYDNLKLELHVMKTKERIEIAKQIAEAREKGDLSENAEYDAAKEAQSLLEFKISQLEQTLVNARVVEGADIDASKVYILSFVKIKDRKTSKVFTYQIVSAKEADLARSRISIESPLGKSMLGKVAGSVINVTVPAGEMEFEILEISR